ncbi:MAG TPA: CoA transferase [Hyphomicrobiaceae bacterium]|nr:CoA transferase [Hyphomicrobiaceae bacterium]
MTTKTTAAASDGALSGVKVVDLSRVLGGPFGTQLLADHGADVIKVEPPQGDEVRDWGPPFDEGDASYFIGINRNKRSIGLDLGKPEGRAVLMKLLDGADILVENFKPGSMEAWGIGYAELEKRFPRLIYCKISGFGAEGPLGGFPGYDGIIGAMTGHYSVNGAPETGPIRLGLPVVDISTGLYSVIGILMALHERGRSGRGQFLDMTLYDSALSLMHPHFPNYYLTGKVPGLTGNTHGNLAPYGMFPTKTCRVVIGAGNNRAYARLITELGHPELAEDPRFKTNGDRVKNRAALNEIIVAALSKHDGVALSLKLLAAGLPCGPVLDTGQVLANEHVKVRRMVVEKDGYKGTGMPIKMSRTPAKLRSRPPRFSEHARQVLAEHGFSEEQMAALAKAGVLVEKRRS